MASTHSNVVGGSTAGLRLICNASVVESAKVPNQSSIYAVHGTALHSVVEWAIAEGLDDDEVLRTFEGMRYTELLSKVEEKEEFGHLKMEREALIEKAIPALMFFDRTVPVNLKRPDDLGVQLEVEMESEARFFDDGGPFDIFDSSAWSSSYSGADPDEWHIPGGKGTADVIFSGKKRHGLIDWKFGDGHIVDPDDPIDGAQFAFYLVLAIHNGHLPVVDEYEAHVFQPAAKLDPEQYHKSRIFTFDELFDFAWDLKDALEAEKRHAVGDHCRNCRGKTACAAYKQWLKKTVDTDIASVSAKELGALRDMVPALEAFVKEVKDAAYRNALDGVEIPGWRLEDALGDRTYKDEKAAWAALGRLGLSADERTIKKTISAPQALELLKKKGVIAKQVDGFEKRHVERPDRGQKLVKCKPGEASGNGLTHLAKVLKHAT